MKHNLSKPAALKEWAVAIEALRSGRQIILMRKGGIREETKDFQVESESFYLFPTYEHQNMRLIKPEFEHRLDETLNGWSIQDTEVTIRCYAKLAEDILIHDEEQLAKLGGLHIWTDSFAGERLKWKRANPLHVLLLRVYELDTPVRLPIVPSYTGCKSWIQLESDALAQASRSPVLDERAFAAAAGTVRQALGA
ncbi:DUF1802 family protein [Paenibacillus piri]|uniref:DUF1802 family protein n=1 Tax=Paenibacillus piri TaxID=2547395 RepID=A0A4V2ZUD5_9BACL|nr:DUF1802 family protein [Paenibacillus piri]TDG00635.1 DUF1802 family protein [Paenibacillus piri]